MYVPYFSRPMYKNIVTYLLPNTQNPCDKTNTDRHIRNICSSAKKFANFLLDWTTSFIRAHAREWGARGGRIYSSVCLALLRILRREWGKFKLVLNRFYLFSALWKRSHFVTLYRIESNFRKSPNKFGNTLWFYKILQYFLAKCCYFCKISKNGLSESYCFKSFL